MNSFTDIARPRLAVMIDGDNIPRSFLPQISAKAAKLGQPVTAQCFCNVALHSDWAKEDDLEIHHCVGKQGKNAADIALVIAALDLAYRGLATDFLIVSKDRDFEPLIRHLVKIGCSAEILKPEAPAKPKATPKRDVVQHVKEAIRQDGSPNGLLLSQLNRLHAQIGFRVSQTPEKQWRAWLRARPEHFICDPKGPDARVRLVTWVAAHHHTAP